MFFSKRNKLLKSCVHYFNTLDQLQIVILKCYLRRDYKINQTIYNQHIHKIRLKILKTIQKIRCLGLHSALIDINQLTNLYEIIFSLDTLKSRVKDHTTFEVCENEIKHITESLSHLLQYIVFILNKKRKNQHPHLKMDALITDFAYKTQAFEELYRSTLQVVSAHPIVFLFFERDLKALRHELESFLLRFS